MDDHSPNTNTTLLQYYDIFTRSSNHQEGCLVIQLLVMESINPFNAVNNAEFSPPRNLASVEGQSQRESTPHSERQRLSTACNQCRKLKVRCDEQQPRCRNCTVRGEVCVTTDPNEPNRKVTRRRARTVFRSLERDPQSLNSPVYSVSHAPEPRPAVSSTQEFGLSSPKSSVTTSPGLVTGRNAKGAEARPTIEQEQQRSSDYSYDREMILNTDHTSCKRKLLGHGTLQALARYLDRYYERKGWELINSKFTFGMQFAEEGPLNELAFGQPLPPLPGLHELDASLEIFSRSIHPLYPVLDLTAF